MLITKFENYICVQHHGRYETIGQCRSRTNLRETAFILNKL
jgi:hypothetical protein